MLCISGGKAGRRGEKGELPVQGVVQGGPDRHQGRHLHHCRG